MIKILAATFLLLSLGAAPGLAQDSRLQAPFAPASSPAERTKPASAATRCAQPPAPVRDLYFQSVYGSLSANRSIIDPEASAAYAEDTAPIRRYQNKITAMANEYRESGGHNKASAACTLSWLAGWARGGALLGAANPTGIAVRKWTLAPIALSYLQIRDNPALDGASRRMTEDWIRAIAWAVIDDYSQSTKKSGQNNHLYWAAWGVMAAAIALDDRNFFDWAITNATTGINQIDREGLLPLELARGRMALKYHIFAIGPLIMVAETARKNGIDLYGLNGNALRRLGSRILYGIDNPSFFAARAGEEQDFQKSLTSSNLAWLEVYNRRYPSDRGSAWLQSLRPMVQSRLGGNITLLYRR